MRRIVTAASLAAAAASLAAGQASAQPRVSGERPFAAEGRLDASDPQDSDERRHDEHRVRLEAGTRYRISVNSEDFDPMVEIRGAGGGDALAQDDDGGDGLNSRLAFTPEASGIYLVRVLGFSTTSEGGYALRIEVPPPLPAPQTVTATFETTSWTVLHGTLVDSDPEGEWGRFDDYLVTLDAGEEVLLRVDSTDFDTMVHVLAADGREGDPLLTDDDSGGGYNALLVFTPEAAGDYIVRVTSYSAAGGGPYRLRIGR